MTNTQTIIVAAAILVAGLMAAGSPQAQSPPTATNFGFPSRVQATASPAAWFVINDEIWFCKEAECKRGAAGK